MQEKIILYFSCFSLKVRSRSINSPCIGSTKNKKGQRNTFFFQISNLKIDGYYDYIRLYDCFNIDSGLQIYSHVGIKSKIYSWHSYVFAFYLQTTNTNMYDTQTF